MAMRTPPFSRQVGFRASCCSERRRCKDHVTNEIRLMWHIYPRRRGLHGLDSTHGLLLFIAPTRMCTHTEWVGFYCIAPPIADPFKRYYAIYHRADCRTRHNIDAEINYRKAASPQCQRYILWSRWCAGSAGDFFPRPTAVDYFVRGPATSCESSLHYA